MHSNCFELRTLHYFSYTPQITELYSRWWFVYQLSTAEFALHVKLNLSLSPHSFARFLENSQSDTGSQPLRHSSSLPPKEWQLLPYHLISLSYHSLYSFLSFPYNIYLIFFSLPNPYQFSPLSLPCLFVSIKSLFLAPSLLFKFWSFTPELRVTFLSKQPSTAFSHFSISVHPHEC